MKLYAAGFNAWGQLDFDARPGEPGEPDKPGEPGEPDDRAAFVCILEDAQIGHVRPELTSTHVTTLRGDRVAGARTDVPAPGPDGIRCEALNGRIVVYKNDTLWQYAAPGEETTTATWSHVLPGLVQVVAYDAGFAALGSQGRVWTWGDGRYPECLGRDIGGECEAVLPGCVTALEDLPSGPIRKIAAGGYALAALTQGQDMYCWGRYLGRQQHRPVLAGLTGEPEPVVVVVTRQRDHDEEEEEELDTVDVGVGDAHMIVLASDGCVYVVGSNANGQLGLGDVEATAPSQWTRVEGIPADGETVVGVYAGARSSFIVVDG